MRLDYLDALRTCHKLIYMASLFLCSVSIIKDHYYVLLSIGAFSRLTLQLLTAAAMVN